VVDDMDLTGLDRRTAEELRAAGSVKWTAFPEAIGAFVAEMDFPIAPAVTAALHAGVDGAVTGYLPAARTADLAAATAEWHRDRYGWEVPAARVHPIADVLSGLAAAIRFYSTPGTAVIVPTPAYMPFLMLPTSLGREIIEVPSLVAAGRHTLDLDGIARAFESGANLLVLCNPWNPVGRVLTREELLAVSGVVEEHGGRVFADEVHGPLVYAEAQHIPYASVSPAAARHSVTATAASKAWNLPGLKCGQLILTNDGDQERWAEVGIWAGHGASTLGVLASTAAYRDGRDWLDGVVDYLDGNRAVLGGLLGEHLPEVGYTMPEGTYIAWLDFRALGLDESPADFFLREAGVALTDGTACGEVGDGHARFVFATPRPILEEAVRRMAEAAHRR
jgi:cysteine-S-conjugate beta-lyase